MNALRIRNAMAIALLAAAALAGLDLHRARAADVVKLNWLDGKPPATAPDLSVFACVGFPQIPGDDAGTASGVQLVVPSRPNDACQSVNHYLLHGCSNDPSCATPWDVAPPSWWPCPITP